MNIPPKLSLACPLPWQSMNGGERRKFCNQCGHHVTNLSLLSRDERLALIARAQVERVCGSYYMRLTGELVTPEKPLNERERGRLAQFGVATLSATALAIVSGCVTPAPKADATASTPLHSTGQVEKSETPASTEAKSDDDEIIVLLGFVVCDPPKPPKVHGPHSK